MKRKILFLVLSFTFIHLFSQPGDMDKVYQDGLNLYNEGSFDRALSTWIGIADSGYTSPYLFYNIGNAAFKTGNIPVSILYYERALLSRPFDEDIRYNLEIAKGYVIDKFNSIPEFFLVRWFRMISLMFSSNLWAIWSLGTFALTLALLLLYLFSTRPGVKRISFITSIFTLLIAISTIFFSFGNRAVRVKKRDAIIFAPSSNGKSSPDISGKDLFIIHEGTKVKIEDEVGGWYEIRLPDGNVGWIQSVDAQKI